MARENTSDFSQEVSIHFKHVTSLAFTDQLQFLEMLEPSYALINATKQTNTASSLRVSSSYRMSSINFGRELVDSSSVRSIARYREQHFTSVCRRSSRRRRFSRVAFSSL
jgi:hypothetical protein